MYSLRNVVDVVRLFIQLSVIQRLFYKGYLIWFPYTGNSNSTYAKYYFEKLASTYDNKHYVHLISSLLKKNSISTPTDISFLSDNKSHDVSIWKLICKYGNPSRCISVPDIGNNKILVYKQELGGHRIKSEFHFHENKLFYISYSFPYIVDKEFSEIIKVILEKYTIPENEANNMFTNYIIDSKGKVISFRNDIIFSLNYYNTDSEFFRWLSQQSDIKVNDVIIKNKLQKEALREVL